MLHPANIIRSKRRTLALYINTHGELIVKAPMNLQNARIFNFVKSKEAWIKTQQAKILQDSFINRRVLSYNSFLFLGVELVPYISENAKKIQKSDNLLLIPSKIANLGEDAVIRKVQLWLKQNAKEIIEERVAYFSGRLQLSYAKISVMNNKTRWGTCSKKGEITLNWRTVMLAPHLLDYIVVHEFCHLLEFNHSRAFWGLVESILPNWRELRKQLKRVNWLLELWRN